MMEINSPTDNPFVPLAFEECQRLCETETTKKELVTSDKVKALITKYGGKNYNISDLKFLLTTLLGFAGLLCMEELLDIKLKHKNTRESLISLNPKIKADQNREGHVVYISRTKSECCSVKYLEVYLQKAKLEISNDNKSPLIYRIFKTKCVWQNTSYELPVDSLKARVEIKKCEFRSTSYDFKSTSSNRQVTSSTLRV